MDCLRKQGIGVLVRISRCLKPKTDAGQQQFDIAKLTALPKLKIL
jgi:hypothetical protein